MKLGAFAKRIKPQDGANYKYKYGVHDEDPVEYDETNGDVIPLDDCPNR